jgi:hypothetical protein
LPGPGPGNPGKKACRAQIDYICDEFHRIWLICIGDVICYLDDSFNLELDVKFHKMATPADNVSIAGQLRLGELLGRT